MASVQRQQAARRTAALCGAAVLVALPALSVLPVPTGSTAPRPTPEGVLAFALRSGTVPYSGLVQVDGWVESAVQRGAEDAVVATYLDSRLRTWWLSPTTWRTDPATAFGSELVPPVAARRMLTRRAPADRLRALAPQTVAGHRAVGVRVVTVTAQTGAPISAVDVWVDARTGLPLELDVYEPGNAEPVFRSRFLQLSLQRPDESLVLPSDPWPVTASLPTNWPP